MLTLIFSIKENQLEELWYKLYQEEDKDKVDGEANREDNKEVGETKDNKGAGDNSKVEIKVVGVIKVDGVTKVEIKEDGDSML